MSCHTPACGACRGVRRPASPRPCPACAGEQAPCSPCGLPHTRHHLPIAPQILHELARTAERGMNALRAAAWLAMAVVAAGFMQPHIPLAPSTLHTGHTFRARHNAICQSERTFAFRPLCGTGDKPAASERPASPPLPALPGLPTVEIEYCTGCRWLLRAAWLAQV